MKANQNELDPYEKRFTYKPKFNSFDEFDKWLEEELESYNG